MVQFLKETGRAFGEPGMNFQLAQKWRVYQYLLTNTATASMIEKATGVHQKNITRYKRELEKDGHLVVVKRDRCKVTTNQADYLTTNPDLVQQNNRQLSLFPNWRVGSYAA